MQVMEGESFTRIGDGKWIKIELTLTEDDLLRVLAEWGAENPTDLRTKIRTSVAYGILSTQAQLLIALRAYSAGGMTAEEFEAIKAKLMARVVKQRSSVGLGGA